MIFVTDPSDVWPEMEKERERGRQPETTTVMSSVKARTPRAQRANIWRHVWQCVSASACTTLILPFVSMMIKTKGGVEHESEKECSYFLAVWKWHLLFFLSLFFLLGGVAGEGSKKCILVGFGEKNVVGELWGGAVLAVLAHVWSATHWALIGQFQGPLGRLRPHGSSFWQNGTSFLEIRAFSTRQGRVPSKLTTQSFNT